MGMIMTEIWRVCKSNEKYEVSNLGNVRHKDSCYNVKLLDNGNGYLKAHAYVKGKHKSYYVHRMVAEAFIENPKNKPCVNHIDCNTHNNNVSNLEWVTHKENSRHSVRVGRLGKNNRGKFGKLNHRHKQVYQYDENHNFIQIWDSVMDIERNLHIRSGHISECCNGKRKKVKGYIWKYEPIKEETNNE